MDGAIQREGNEFGDPALLLEKSEYFLKEKDTVNAIQYLSFAIFRIKGAAVSLVAKALNMTNDLRSKIRHPQHIGVVESIRRKLEKMLDSQEH